MSIISSFVYLSCLVKSSSKQVFVPVTNLNLALSYYGVRPSAYKNLSLSESLNLYFNFLKTGENIAATAYLYHNIGLACYCFHCSIGSSFKSDSSLMCNLMSDISFVFTQSYMYLTKSFSLFLLLLVSFSHSAVSYQSIYTKSFINCFCSLLLKSLTK